MDQALETEPESLVTAAQSGRCCVCGLPCAAGCGTELCDDCVPKVEAVYEAQRLLDPHPEGPGWFVANDHEIQRCDTRALFVDDEEAAVFVVSLVAPPSLDVPDDV